MKRALATIASAVFVVSLATGCGGSDGGSDRPSVDDIAGGIQDNMGAELGGDVSDELANCIAKAFHESDLSDGALQAIVDGDKDYKASDEDQDALKDVSTGSVTDCAKDATTETPAP